MVYSFFRFLVVMVFLCLPIFLLVFSCMFNVILWASWEFRNSIELPKAIGLLLYFGTLVAAAVITRWLCRAHIDYCFVPVANSPYVKMIFAALAVLPAVCFCIVAVVNPPQPRKPSAARRTALAPGANPRNVPFSQRLNAALKAAGATDAQIAAADTIMEKDELLRSLQTPKVESNITGDPDVDPISTPAELGPVPKGKPTPKGKKDDTHSRFISGLPRKDRPRMNDIGMPGAAQRRDDMLMRGQFIPQKDMADGLDAPTTPDR